MKQLASIAGTVLLALAVPGLASEPNPYSPADTAASDSLPAPPQLYGSPDDPGPTALTADDLEAVAGMGPKTDFACGAITGVGLAVTLSGAGAPLGIGLSFAGFGCSLLF